MHKLLKPSKSNLVIGRNNTQYFQITLGTNRGTRICYKLHRLVATYFIRRPKPLEQVNHIDGNRLNNELNNLEWVTPSENLQKAVDNNLTKSILNIDIVRDIQNRFSSSESKTAALYLKNIYGINLTCHYIYLVLTGRYTWKRQ